MLGSRIHEQTVLGLGSGAEGSSPSRWSPACASKPVPVHRKEGAAAESMKVDIDREPQRREPGAVQVCGGIWTLERHIVDRQRILGPILAAEARMGIAFGSPGVHLLKIQRNSFSIIPDAPLGLTDINVRIDSIHREMLDSQRMAGPFNSE